jgi:murein tripeptide amidase MpaA
VLLAFALWGVLWAAIPGHAHAADRPQPQEPLFRLVEIRFADQADINRLAGRLDVWEVHRQRRVLVAHVTAAQEAQLRREGYSVQPAPLVEAAAIPNFACYRTVEETYTDLARLAQERPQLAQWSDIGDSWRKVRSGGAEGYDLNVLVLTNTQIPGPKPRLFVMAAIHARELTTAEVATRFAEHLVTQFGSDPEATWLLDYNEVHILAQSNPDGRKRAEVDATNYVYDPQNPYESNLWWRKNVNDDLCADPRLVGVDLNRNSSFRWGGCMFGGCSSTDPCSIVYRGRSPASEPETQAIEAYIRSLFPDRRGPNDTDAAPPDTQGVMLSLHAYSPRVLFPWGWSIQPAPNDAGLRTLGRKFGYYTGYEACQSGQEDCIYLTDGTTDDFAYGELGVASYTFELGTAFFQQCSDFETYILTQTIDALTYAAKVAARPYQLPSGPDVVQVSVTPASVGVKGHISLRAEADDTRTKQSFLFGNEPIKTITAVSYTVDAPSWIPGAGSPVSMPPLDTFDTPRETAVATIDTLGWAPGRHTIFVQAADAAGNVGPPTAVFVEVGLPLYLPYIGVPQPQKVR